MTARAVVVLVAAAWLGLAELAMDLLPACEVTFMTPIVRSLEAILAAVVVAVLLPRVGGDVRRERLPRAQVR